MSFLLILLLASSLAMDAFAVSVANGICRCGGGALKTAARCGFAFGFFQAVMPLAGYLAGYSFSPVIGEAGRWAAMILLGVIGGHMVLDAVRDMRDPRPEPPRAVLSSHMLITQAFATSIDALAVGVGLGFLEESPLLTSAVIGSVTFFACFTGVLIGRICGYRLGGRAQLLGGIILILIGLRVVAEQFLGFW